MVIAYAILGLIIAGGGYLAFKGLLNIQRSIASEKWPKTTGQIVSSETSRDVTAGNRRHGATITFNTRTVVSYQVDGRQYSTDVEHFGQTLGSGDPSEAAVKRLRYPQGKAVNVFYNPASPGVGVIRPGLHADAFWLVGAGLAFALPCILCLFLIPSMFARVDPEGSDFEQQVEQAIDAGRRGAPVSSIKVDLPGPMPGSKPMAIAAGFFGCVFCGLGLLALTAGISRYWNGNASLSWPTTSGAIVTASKVDSDDESGLDSGTDSAWYARFVYQYTVNGIDHFNNKRRFAGVEGGSDSDASRLRETYKRGAAVKVSYSPSDPDVAVLEPGNSKDSFIIPGIGIVALLFGAAVLVFIVPSVLRG